MNRGIHTSLKGDFVRTEDIQSKMNIHLQFMATVKKMARKLSNLGADCNKWNYSETTGIEGTP